MQLQIGDITYSTSGKMDAFTQLNLARKLGSALPLVETLIDPDNQGKDPSILVVMALSRLSDSDSDYVVRKSLGLVFRKQGNGQPYKVLSPDGSLMFDDMTLNDITRITAEVVQENLGGFLREALGPLKQESTQTS